MTDLCSTLHYSPVTWSFLVYPILQEVTEILLFGKILHLGKMAAKFIFLLKFRSVRVI